MKNELTPHDIHLIDGMLNESTGTGTFGMVCLMVDLYNFDVEPYEYDFQYRELIKEELKKFLHPYKHETNKSPHSNFLVKKIELFERGIILPWFASIYKQIHRDHEQEFMVVGEGDMLMYDPDDEIEYLDFRFSRAEMLLNHYNIDFSSYTTPWGADMDEEQEEEDCGCEEKKSPEGLAE